MKRHPTPLWPGWNLSYHYQQAACSKQHGGSTVTVVVAAPTSWTPPKHTPTPQLNKVLITPHSFLSKCLPNHKRVTGLRAWTALTTAGAWCAGKHGGPEALIKMAMTPLRRAHIHAVSHTGSSLSLSALGSGIHLQASLLALLEVPAGSSLPLYGNRCRGGRVRHHREKFLMEIHDQDGCRGWIRTQTATNNCILQVLKTSSSSSSAFVSPG